nr:MAG TPA: hypothetical protein [Bacteriophage sp.]
MIKHPEFEMYVTKLAKTLVYCQRSLRHLGH